MTLRGTAVAILLSLALAGCTQHFGWYQKLTVTIQTPAVEVSGASVTAVKVDCLDGLLPDGGGVESRLTGEAVVVEIAPGRYLFVLLTGALGWADAAYGLGGPGTVFEENMRSVEAQRGEPPVPLPPKPWPLWSPSPTSPTPRPWPGWTRMILPPSSGRGCG